MAEVLLPVNFRILYRGSLSFPLGSTIRSNGAFRRGTVVGTGSKLLRAKCVAITSSSNVYISCLSKHPKICSTHCSNRRNGSRVGGSGLLSRLLNIPVRGHATCCITTVTYIFPSNERFAIENRYRKRVTFRERDNGNNFNCSPLFVDRGNPFDRLATSRGSGVDREKHTLHLFHSRLGGCVRIGWYWATSGRRDLRR